MYGIIDCDNCYLSCGRVFRSDLKDKPVVVLSNNLKEAKEYMKNETLAARLREITNALLEHTDKRAEDILGYVDDMKVKSSMTLFDIVCHNDIFDQVLQQFYGGERCGRTLRMIEGG